MYGPMDKSWDVKGCIHLAKGQMQIMTITNHRTSLCNIEHKSY